MSQINFPEPLHPFRPQLPAEWSSKCFLAVFNRYGGISPRPYDSLNLSFNVGDRSENVRLNREKVKKSLAADILVSSAQVHGSNVLVLKEKPDDDKEYEGYDALITNEPGIALMVQLADCQSVMLLDPVKKAVANIHCGWRGNVANFPGKVAGEMSKHFQSRQSDLLAYISPSLGPCCAQFINYRDELPPSFDKYRLESDHFNLWAVSRDQLIAAGVAYRNIQIAAICTKCNREWFSYRRERDTGRFATVVGIRE